MAKNTSIVLGDHFDAFIGSLVSDGRYGSASEVVREGLRLVEEREAKLNTLRAALVEGEESGNPASFDKKTFLKDMRAQHAD